MIPDYEALLKEKDMIIAYLASCIDKSEFSMGSDCCFNDCIKCATEEVRKYES